MAPCDYAHHTRPSCLPTESEAKAVAMQAMCYGECGRAVFHFISNGSESGWGSGSGAQAECGRGSGSDWVREIYCAKSTDDEFCLPEVLKMENATEPTVEMLDVSSLRVVQCGVLTIWTCVTCCG